LYVLTYLSVATAPQTAAATTPAIETEKNSDSDPALIATMNQSLKADSYRWDVGYTKHVSASELVLLLQQLARSSPVWNAELRNVLRKSLSHASELLNALNGLAANKTKVGDTATELQLSTLIACLSLLGGLLERVRVGGRVSFTKSETDPHRFEGTVVRYNVFAGTARVATIGEGEHCPHIQKVKLLQLAPLTSTISLDELGITAAEIFDWLRPLLSPHVREGRYKP
jgi:hypothetical protein